MIASRRAFHSRSVGGRRWPWCAASAPTVHPHARPSAALPLRRALLGEGGQSFCRGPRTRAARPAAPSTARPGSGRPATLRRGPRCRLACTASGAADAIWRARRRASSSAAPGSTSRLTRPRSNARRASTGSPVRMASIAVLRPIVCGSRNRPPAAAIRLRRTSASPNADRDVATTMSAARTISSPPAVASPSTATTIGFIRWRYTNPPNPPRLVSRVAAEPVSRMTLRSAPA